MKSDWLTSTSFERTLEVVSAINTLLIQAKLKQEGVHDPIGDVDIRQAQDRLTAFLNQFEAVLHTAEQSQSGTIVGTDPRLGQLALHFLTERRRGPQHIPLYARPLSHIGELIRSDRDEDIPDLIACLEVLRSLFEQHGYADIVGLFSEH